VPLVLQDVFNILTVGFILVHHVCVCSISMYVNEVISKIFSDVEHQVACLTVALLV